MLITPIIEKDVAANNLNENDLIENSLSQFSEEVRQFFNENGLTNFKIIEVANELPLTRLQFEKANVLWPVTWRENAL